MNAAPRWKGRAMPQAPAPDRGASADRDQVERPRCYGALDLGTNNCRLLIATPAGGGFRVVEAFSRIVRLGEGLTHTGMLQDAAIERSIAALKICAEKVARRRVLKLRAVATQACRSAANGPAFISRVREETGLDLTIIEPEEEARLSVAGCSNLMDRSAEAALVVDVGGGSTELSWVTFSGEETDRRPRLISWLSIPIGVVSLAERFPEPDIADDAWWNAMVGAVRTQIAAFGAACEVGKAAFAESYAHEKALRALAVSRLTAENEGLRVLSSDAAAPGILSISLPGYRSETLMNALEVSGIYVSKSSACKKGHRSYVLEELGLPADVIDGAIRLSFSRFTTEEEVSFFCDELRRVRQSVYTKLR